MTCNSDYLDCAAYPAFMTLACAAALLIVEGFAPHSPNNQKRRHACESH
jgi:hypothetical protein